MILHHGKYEGISKRKYFRSKISRLCVRLEREGRYEAYIRSGTSTNMSPNAFNTDFENLDFFLPIQVTFGRHQHIVASGIFGNILFIVWRVTFFLLVRF